MERADFLKKISMLDSWIKRYIGGKSFLYVAGRATRKKQVCVARSYYGHSVALSDWMTLDEMEAFLFGIVSFSEIKRQAKKIGYHRGYMNMLESWGLNVPGHIEKGRIL